MAKKKIIKKKKSIPNIASLKQKVKKGISTKKTIVAKSKTKVSK